jgi:hypothetical protein
MTRFSDFVASIERLAVAALSLQDRIAIMDDGRPLVPVTRSAIERAAEDLADRIGRETPFEQPRDMIEEEWNERPVVELREAVATLELVVATRPSDVRSWIPDAVLALTAFFEARERFRRDTEF